MKVIIPAEIIFAISTLLFTVALFYASLIIRKLLKLIKPGSKIYISLLFSALFMLGVTVLHLIRIGVIFPSLAHARSWDILPLLIGAMKISAFEGGMLLLAGIFAYFSVQLYHVWSSR
ncbi:hypothetical protein J7J58_05555 [candidate division WOR-3 bacterium]|uniref:Uncharacterized protein n=1 Tax=candidate division TA06 bacterium TaxID=2250710 RepID=A0A660S6M5_UNCT6|nr:hypothetical protein [candidate division WOR-3 bacterium]RKX65442.1 MAG: hypothetical protein DRP44_06365 [candidate division TA06 bacterium]